MITHFTGSARFRKIESLWGMYVLSYKNVGMQFHTPDEMLKEVTHFQVAKDELNKPVAFAGYKKTKFGFKIVVLSSDKSMTGKRECASLIKNIDSLGHYGELCGKPQSLALELGLKPVSVEKVAKVLQKKIEILDNFNYIREVKNVGMSQKIMFGQPII